MSLNPASALVLFSGGQDSTTCLAWALSRYAHVETVGFDYGQRHHVEMDCRLQVLAQLRQQFPNWSPRLGEDHVLDLRVLGQLSDSALTDERAIAMAASGLPNTFVPGRNLLFLTFAATLAWLLAKGKDWAPIPGTIRVNHLEENVASVDVALTADQVLRLDNVTQPLGEHHGPAQMTMLER